MDKIKETDKIKHLVRLAELSKGIIAKVQAMPDLQDLKLDLDIIRYVCDLIENNIKYIWYRSNCGISVHSICE